MKFWALAGVKMSDFAVILVCSGEIFQSKETKPTVFLNKFISFWHLKYKMLENSEKCLHNSLIMAFSSAKNCEKPKILNLFQWNTKKISKSAYWWSWNQLFLWLCGTKTQLLNSFNLSAGWILNKMLQLL